MSALPRSLARWRTELSIFPPELAAVLGSIVLKLAGALGSGVRRDAVHDGEPDGFDGIARRGSYERLLFSEWAVQKSAPLEFLRRAVDAEHAFLNLSRVRPAAKRGSVVLFDAGPEQLGACRIVQLAALVLLAERARRRGASFYWQQLLGLGEGMRATVDQQSVFGFLASRTALEAGPDAVQEWLAQYAGFEIWLVASRKLLTVAGHGAFRIALDEVALPDRDAVEVTLLEPRRPARSLVLDLPEPALATRLLRNPFTVPARVRLPAADRPASNLVLDAKGSRVFYRDQGGELRCVTLPNSHNDKPVVRRVPCRAGMRLVGGGFRGRHMIWMMASRGVVVLASHKPLRRDVEPVLECPAPNLEPPNALWPLVTSQSPLTALFVARDHSLWRLDFLQKRATLVAEGVTALAPLGLDSALAAVTSYGGSWGNPAVLRIDPSTVTALPLSYAGGAVQLRALQDEGDVTYVIAAEQADGRWIIERLRRSPRRDEQSQITLRPTGGDRVVGVDATGDGLSDLGLYTLDREATSLHVVGRYHSRLLARTRSPIVEIAVASGRGRVAYMSEAGELGAVNRGGDGRVSLELGE